MNELVQIHGDEQSRVDPNLPDAGLPPVVGVQSRCVFRASRDAPELADTLGYTYHHHVDMACWRGRLYVGWNACQRDEDVWPSRELFSTSEDGVNWTAPAEMFPQGVSTCLRMYFYLAPAGRMLLIAGLRCDRSKTSEDAKAALVVREIRADHTLGDVFTLQPPAGAVPHPPMFETAGDRGFVESCRSLLADTVFLEQQDRGRLLGDRRMKWHDPAAWPGGKVPGDNEKWVAGKAFSFFRRPDGAIVGVSKMGWTTISFDDGRTWQQPAVPPTLVTGKAKVWSQQTADGRFALVYNPSARNRFPLIVVTGEDGVNFRDMRIVQGELPIQRYAGADRSIGPQYVRGISRWSDDGSRAGENAMWLVYSMSKEDIWVSRVNLPIKPDETGTVTDSFQDWNLYCPKWAGITDTGGALRLENRDPYDHASATRVFPECERLRLRFEVLPESIHRSPLQIDVRGKIGAARPIRISLEPDGRCWSQSGADRLSLGLCAPGRWLGFDIDADARAGQFSIAIDGQPVLRDAPFAEPAASLHRITFRTGEHRGIGGKNPVPAGTDRPVNATVVSIRDVRVGTE